MNEDARTEKDDSGVQGPGPASQPGGISDELMPYVDRSESEEINRVGEWLASQRPVPSPGFRAELHGRLSALADKEMGWRPRRLRLVATAYTGCGLALMAVAAIGLAGTGPLA